MPKVRVLTACAVIVLTGCQVSGGTDQELEEPVAPEAAVETEASAAAPPPTDEPEQAAPSEPELAAVIARPTEKPTPPPRSGPDDLLRLAADDLRTKLGPPASERDEPPARVWRYAIEDCVLEVYLFLDVTESVRRVLAYDITTPEGSANDDLACYRKIEHRHAVTLQSSEPR